MTRETKIGLLVGLAFIIVIGILLSDHLTSSNEPPQAALGGAGNSVRQAVGSPGSGGAGAPVTIVTPIITPRQPVATQNELTPTAPPVIVVGPAAPAPVQPAQVQPQTVAQQQQGTTPQDTIAEKTADAQQASSNDNPIITQAKQPAQTQQQDNLAAVAEAHGTPLVNMDDPSKQAKTASYVAQPGDSVSKMASKFLGSSSKANVDLIVKANPSLHGDPTKLMAGKSYQIPSPIAKAASPAPAPAATNNPTHDADDAITLVPVSSGKPTPTPAVENPVTGYVYTVQPGDNLTKIAREQLGDVHAIASIQELNTDKLKGDHHDIVIAGSKLRLPGKPLAKAD